MDAKLLHIYHLHFFNSQICDHYTPYWQIFSERSKHNPTFFFLATVSNQLIAYISCIINSKHVFNLTTLVNLRNLARVRFACRANQIKKHINEFINISNKPYDFLSICLRCPRRMIAINLLLLRKSTAVLKSVISSSKEQKHLLIPLLWGNEV